MAQPPIEMLAKEWLRMDKDHTTREEISRLLDQGDTEELEKRLRTRIAFGTAGLRAAMQAGFSRLNALTIIQASQGLAAYLLEHTCDARRRGVVIGRDARHNSDKFARLAAAAMVAKGIRVWWYEDTVHTPLVPFGVGELSAAAGIMITASHNPAQDNGYKVYWGNGCQIIPPHDIGIATAIDQNLEPMSWDASIVDEGNELIQGALGLVRGAYFKAVRNAALSDHLPVPAPLDCPRFVYTPMHGVGLPYMVQAVSDLGFQASMHVVEAQAHPDPTFPTVKFPNPEEKGALDLVQRAADKIGSMLVMASDPDADRLAVAEKVDGEWHQFTGNQLGVLLASYVFATYPAHKPLRSMAMLASAVSSRMLSIMAEVEGFRFEETLTGFKWLGNVGLNLERDGYDVSFAYEEALGYMLPSVVCDKDSVAANAAFLVAAAHWASQGRSPYQQLQSLYDRYGQFQEANTSLVSPSPATTNSIFAAIRALRHPHPQTLASRAILRWRDLTVGFDSATEDGLPTLPTDKNTQMITCELDGHVRFAIRSSGTEPKIKVYVECRAASAANARKSANEVMRDLVDEWIKPVSAVVAAQYDNALQNSV